MQKPEESRPDAPIELAKLDLDPAAERALRVKVRAAFEEAHAPRRSAMASFALKNLPAPAFVCGVAGLYLVWAFDRAIFLLGH
ncbi:MAG: hypothetical protein JNL38_17745 [Myxococcales bacterium]|jgi:hypothetical protein|nr:hypothetical protein [Myxococcales bacterium]